MTALHASRPGRIWCDLSVLDHADGLCRSCPPAPPLRLTARGNALVAAVLLVLIFGGLLAAGLLGQHWRCERLQAASHPLTATYCDAPTSQETQ